MSLKLHSAVNGNKPRTELIWAKASGETNLNNYAVIDRTFDHNTQLSNEFRHIYFFPPLVIADGDWVRLFTGTGTYSAQKVENKDGETIKNNLIHNFYWGSNACVWNDAGGDIATLLLITPVNSVTVPAVKDTPDKK